MGRISERSLRDVNCNTADGGEAYLGACTHFSLVLVSDPRKLLRCADIVFSA